MSDDPLNDLLPWQKHFQIIENLVLEGGGVKGIAYVGALEALDEASMYAGIQRVAGSSAGGITAMLIGLGYSVDEIKDVISSLNFQDLMDPDNPFWLPDKFKIVDELIRFLESDQKKGVYRGEVFLDLAKSFVSRALPEFGPNATFGDLKKSIELDIATKGYSRLKNMVFTGTNLSTGETEYFSFDNPDCLDMPIALAVRITMSFPGAFQGVKWKDNFYIDGGVGDNLPMEIFDDIKYFPKGLKRTKMGNNPRTLGLKIDSANEIYGFDSSKSIGTLEYLQRIIGIHTSDSPKHSKKKPNIIQIYDEEVSTLDFSLNAEKKNQLIHSGKSAINDWLLERQNQVMKVTNSNNSLIALSDKDIIIQYFYLKDRIKSLSADSVIASQAAKILRKLEEVALQKNINFNSKSSRSKYIEYLTDLNEQLIVKQNQDNIQEELKMTHSERLDFEWSVCQERMLTLIDIKNKLNDTIQHEIESLKLYDMYCTHILELIQIKPIGEVIFNFLIQYQENLVKIDDLQNKLLIAKEKEDGLEQDYTEKIIAQNDKKNTLTQLLHQSLDNIEGLENQSKGLILDFVSEVIRDSNHSADFDPSITPLPLNLQETKNRLENSRSSIEEEIARHKLDHDKLNNQYTSLETRLTHIKTHDIRQSTYDQLLTLERDMQKTIRENYNLYSKMGAWLKKRNKITFGIFNWLMRVTPGNHYEKAMEAMNHSANLKTVKRDFQDKSQKEGIGYVHQIRDELSKIQKNTHSLVNQQKHKKSGQMLKLYQNKKMTTRENKDGEKPKTLPSSLKKARKKGTPNS
jgi:NTE family protein